MILEINNQSITAFLRSFIVEQILDYYFFAILGSLGLSTSGSYASGILEKHLFSTNHLLGSTNKSEGMTVDAQDKM